MHVPDPVQAAINWLSLLVLPILLLIFNAAASTLAGMAVRAAAVRAVLGVLCAWVQIYSRLLDECEREIRRADFRRDLLWGRYRRLRRRGYAGADLAIKLLMPVVKDMPSDFAEAMSTFAAEQTAVGVYRATVGLAVARRRNRSELHTRLGLAQGVTFPRVLGIEATGIVAAAPGGEFPLGQQVATLMGGMGRTFDGGYAEYTCVPATQVVPFRSELDWATLGAVPEMLQTANGSLSIGLDAQPGQTLLIRGGTSSVGMAAAVLAKDRGLTVLSTTRSADRAAALEAIGVDHVLIDDGDIASKVRGIVPAGVELALELVGTPTLPDTLRATAVHGVVCFTGMLSNQWIVRDFYPIDYLPRGVRLTAYSGDARDLPAAVLQSFLDAVAAGRLTVPVHRTYRLDEIATAHADMEAGRATGKLVVLP